IAADPTRTDAPPSQELGARSRKRLRRNNSGPGTITSTEAELVAQFQFGMESRRWTARVAREHRTKPAPAHAAANGKGSKNFGIGSARSLAANAGLARKSALERSAKRSATERARFCQPTARLVRNNSNCFHRHPG